MQAKDLFTILKGAPKDICLFQSKQNMEIVIPIKLIESAMYFSRKTSWFKTYHKRVKYGAIRWVVLLYFLFCFIGVEIHYEFGHPTIAGWVLFSVVSIALIVLIVSRLVLRTDLLYGYKITEVDGTQMWPNRQPVKLYQLEITNMWGKVIFNKYYADSRAAGHALMFQMKKSFAKLIPKTELQ